MLFGWEGGRKVMAAFYRLHDWITGVVSVPALMLIIKYGSLPLAI